MNNCQDCVGGKEFIPSKSLAAITTYKQWGSIVVPNQSKKKQNENNDLGEVDGSTYTKISIITKEVPVGEVPDEFKEHFAKAAAHCHVKRFQEREFQNDLKDDNNRILQIDYAMAYQCELQKEDMGISGFMHYFQNSIS